ncbi:DUF2157 domain-containing protein [uncultured Cardiobacterium sp.]|uniref:DUF2157 domain-containing protein n=1 Tax=uncultured Cardiobacterium sp. TaxID=417619 RepID=UPI00261E724B|nr:DUF2157 domain-containing protein [uncultured Cardiobacterium sp.]
MNRRAAFSRDLLAELPQWEASGWVSPEQAALLRARYVLPVRHRGQWWQMVLSLFAALCVGAGIIALFAANWASLTRPLRVVLSLTPLALSQAALYFACWRRPASTVWREGSALLVALSTGAAIALIAQTYHVEEDLPAFLRVWLWLTLLLAYVARSWAVVFFAALLAHFIGIYSNEPLLFDVAFYADWEYVFYVAAFLPWLCPQRQPGLHYGGQTGIWRTFAALHTTAFALILCTNSRNAGFLPAWVCLSAFYLAARTLLPAWRNIMAVLGKITLAVLLLFGAEMTMREPVADALLADPQLIAVSGVLLLFAVCRWRRLQGWDLCFVLSGIVIYLLAQQGIRERYGDIWPWLPTVFVIILGLWRARLDLDRSLFAVNSALIWVLMALFLRFVGDNMPLWVKGLVFITAGIAFFTVNLHLARRPRPTGETA